MAIESSVGPLTPRQQRLKDEFVAARGYWSELWDGVLQLDADFFEAYSRFSIAPWKHGPLEPKVKELIYIAIDAATTHLFVPGIRIHVQNALRHGATVDEVMEVFELTSVLGIHTLNIGVPILIEELAAAGIDDGSQQEGLSEREQALKDEFVATRGYWPELWDGVLKLDPEFFSAYAAFSSVPWRSGTLPAKVKELVYVAIDSSTTHLYPPGLRIHIRNALRHGATAAELMEVFELTSVLGIHTCTVGVPVLLELAESTSAERPAG